jgi:hypothetical protein
MRAPKRFKQREDEGPTMNLCLPEAVAGDGGYRRYDAENMLLVVARPEGATESNIALMAIEGEGGWYWSASVVYVSERNGGPVESRGEAERAAMSALGELQQQHEREFGHKLRLPWEK